MKLTILKVHLFLTSVEQKHTTALSLLQKDFERLLTEATEKKGIEPENVKEGYITKNKLEQLKVSLRAVCFVIFFNWATFVRQNKIVLETTHFTNAFIFFIPGRTQRGLETTGSIQIRRNQRSNRYTT